MDLLWFVFFALLMMAARAENFASCAKTWCPTEKQCRIVQRCWKTDCQVGTTCLDVEVSLALSNKACKFDSPLLRSDDGGPLFELGCGMAYSPRCPDGSMCQGDGLVCCTGANKTDAGLCPVPVSSQFFKVRGDCASFCRHDQECPGLQRCCPTGLQCNACMDPEPSVTCQGYPCDPGTHCVMQANICTTYPCLASPTCTPDKTGTCPALTPRTGCQSECKVDSHCPGDLKCCTLGDCGVCVTPSSSTPPLPPPSSVSSSPSSSSNTSSWQLAAGDLGSDVPTSSLSADTPLASAGTSSTMLDPSSSTLPGSATSDLTGPALGASSGTGTGTGARTYDLVTQWKNLLTGTSGGTSGSGFPTTVAGSTNPFGSMFPTMGNAGTFGSGALSFNTLMQNAQKLMSSIQQGANPFTVPSTSSSNNLVQGSGTEATSGNMPTMNNIISPSGYGSGSAGTSSLFNGGGISGSQGSVGGGMLNHQPPFNVPTAGGGSSSPQQTPGGNKCGMSCMMMFAMMSS